MKIFVDLISKSILGAGLVEIREVSKIDLVGESFGSMCMVPKIESIIKESFTLSEIDFTADDSENEYILIDYEGEFSELSLENLRFFSFREVKGLGHSNSDTNLNEPMSCFSEVEKAKEKALAKAKVEKEEEEQAIDKKSAKTSTVKKVVTVKPKSKKETEDEKESKDGVGTKSKADSKTKAETKEKTKVETKVETREKVKKGKVDLRAV